MENISSRKNIALLLYVPGMSGFDNFEIMRALEIRSQERGFIFQTLDSWNNKIDLANKTVLDIQNDIDRQISKIKESSNLPLFVIGKSFGGGMLLFKRRQDISKMVLWAPAIGISPEESNVKEFDNKVIRDIDSVFDLCLSTNTLSSIDTPVRVVYGHNDKIVPKAIINKISLSLPSADLIELDGIGHTPKDERELNELLDATFAFLYV